MRILNRFKILLRYADALMPQKAAETVEIKTILQLLMGECVAASVRGHSDFWIDADSISGFLHKNADSFMREQLSVFAEKNIVLFKMTASETLFPRVQVFVEKFPDGGVFWDNTLFSAFAVDDEIIVLDLVELHVY